MKWFEDCACLTITGNCTKDVKTVKGRIVGMQRCPLVDGVKTGCAYYYTIKLGSNGNEIQQSDMHQPRAEREALGIRSQEGDCRYGVSTIKQT